MHRYANRELKMNKHRRESRKQKLRMRLVAGTQRKKNQFNILSFHGCRRRWHRLPLRWIFLRDENTVDFRSILFFFANYFRAFGMCRTTHRSTEF